MTLNMSEKGLKEADPKEITLQFFDPAGKAFENVEMIMQAIAVCSVKHSCESVLESFVSRYENHFDARRNTDEDTSNEEFEIAVNGPSLAHCDTVVKEAMDNYWREKSKDGLGEWHFLRTSVLEKLKKYDTSEVLARKIKKKNNLPFMN